MSRQIGSSSTAKSTADLLRIVFPLLLIILLITLVVPWNQQAAPRLIITEFSDFQCPYCQRAANVVEQVRAHYGERVQVVFKQMPLRMHANAFRAAQASVCAREQGRFWEYHDRLFASGDLSVEALHQMALEVGLQPESFRQCLSSEKSKTEVSRIWARLNNWASPVHRHFSSTVNRLKER